MAAVWYHFRSSFRRRARSYIGVAVLIGLLGGVSMASLAGARRTASAYARFRAAGNPSDIQVNPNVEGAPDSESVAELLEKTRALPGVTRTASYAAFFAGPLAPDGKADLSYVEGEAVGSIDGLYFDQDRFAPTSGRLPDPSRADEIAVGEQMAKAHGLRVGQRLAIGVWRPDAEDTFFETNPDPNDRLDVTVVGIGLFNDEVVQDDVDRTPRALFTPASTQREAAYMSYIWTGVQLRRGDADVAQFKRDYEGILPEGSQVNSRLNSVITTQAQRAIRPLAVALGAFGTLCAIATLLLLSQAVARIVAAEREDLRILRAMGAGPAQTATMELPGAVVSIVGGTLLAVAVAAALSPLTPIGPARPVEAQPGVSFDWTVLGLGGLLIATALGVITLMVALRQSSHRRAAQAVPAARRPSTAVGAAASAGLPVPAVAGMRLALERQQVRGRQGQLPRSVPPPQGKCLVTAFRLGLEPLQDHRRVEDGPPHPQCASRASRSARMAAVESSSQPGFRAKSSVSRSNAACTLGEAPGPLASPRASAATLLRYALRDSLAPRAASSMRRSRASSMETSTLAAARVYPDSRPTKAALVLRTE